LSSRFEGVNSAIAIVIAITERRNDPLHCFKNCSGASVVRGERTMKTSDRAPSRVANDSADNIAIKVNLAEKAEDNSKLIFVRLSILASPN